MDYSHVPVYEAAMEQLIRDFTKIIAEAKTIEELETIRRRLFALTLVQQTLPFSYIIGQFNSLSGHITCMDVSL